MIDVKRLQTRLIGLGYDIGAADSAAGPKTMTAVLARVAGRPMSPLADLGAALAKYAPRFGLLDTVPRFANFVGQACHESGRFRYLREIWGPTDQQRKYEGRADLGNTQPGDGKRYMGRGIFQITGRANYTEMAMRTGQPLVDHPELVETPDLAVLTACIYWQSRKLSLLADAGKEDDISRRINGGVIGIAERRQMVGIVKGLLL